MTRAPRVKPQQMFPHLSRAICLLAHGCGHDPEDDDIILSHAIMSVSALHSETLPLGESVLSTMSEDEVEQLLLCPDSTPAVNKLLLAVYDQLCCA